VQADGLQAAYSDAENPELCVGVHQLLSLASVPEEDVVAPFDVLMAGLPDQLEDFVDRFEKTYVRGRQSWGRRPSAHARYQPKTWN